jgi:hypothetical protein
MEKSEEGKSEPMNSEELSSGKDSLREEESIDSARLKNTKGEEQIQLYIEGFDEMIKFMDFSFERAFQ